LKRKRLIGFILAIVLGLSAALIYGWLIAPAQPAATTLSSLRADYQADYVLMVAEAYPQTPDLSSALEMLRRLDPEKPIAAVDQALLTAQKLGYSDADMHLLIDLKLRLNQYGGE
jgi:hypothetical protein